jgi:hypothetical protein
MNILFPFVFLIVVLIMIVSGFIIFGLVHRPVFPETSIDPGTIGTEPFCARQKVNCTSDEDCKICADNVEIKCIEIKRNDSDAQKKYGPTEKVCLPAKVPQNCNAKNGGILAWTGWSSTDRMEWDCLCTYPQFAGNQGCQDLNPNVCQGGIWTYDATVETKPPDSSFCHCPPNSHLMESNNGIPFCLPIFPNLCNNPTMCSSQYSNSRFIN